MTEQESILRLRDHFSVHDDGRPTPKLNEAVSIVIKATKKQIPIKVRLINCYGFKCPCCGTGYLKGKPKYCDNCGQKLDWREV